jgi:hypothetical protein
MSNAFDNNLSFSISVIILFLSKVILDLNLIYRFIKKNKIIHYPKIYFFMQHLLICNSGLIFFSVINIFTPIKSDNNINKILCSIQSVGIRIFLPSFDILIIIYGLLLYYEVFDGYNLESIKNGRLYVYFPYFIFSSLQIPEYLFKDYNNENYFNGVYCFENKNNLFHTKTSFYIFFSYFVKFFCFLIIIVIFINMWKNIQRKQDVFQAKVYKKYIFYKMSFIFFHMMLSILIFIVRIILIYKNHNNNEINKNYYWIIVISNIICGIIFSILYAWNSNLFFCRIGVTRILSQTSSVNSEVTSELSSVF